MPPRAPRLALHLQATLLALAGTLALSLLLLASAAGAHVARLEIAGKKLSIETNAGKPEKNKLAFESAKGQDPLLVEHDPTVDEFRVLVIDGSDGAKRSSLATLDPALWKVMGKAADPKGWKYKDKTGSRGGITEVVLDRVKGRLKIKGKGENFDFPADGTLASVQVHVGLEDEWYCAEFGGTVQKNEVGHFKARDAEAPGACPEILCGNGVREVGEECDDGNLEPTDCCTNECTLSGATADFDSTFAAIQTVILDGYGCTSSLCHGDTDPHESGLNLQTALGGADLETVLDANHQALLSSVPADNPNYAKFVVQGDSKTSLLYAALFKKTHCNDNPTPPAECTTLEAQGVEGMPESATLSAEELEAVDLWLRFGAPRQGVVDGTADKLDACLPPATPGKIDPPEPPGAGNGVQLVSSAWLLPAESEDEICFATYFDFTNTGLIPADQQFDCPGAFGPNNASDKCFYYHRRRLVQDPQSHHSIIFLYKGAAGAHDVLEPQTPYRQFGPWTYKTNDPSDEKNGDPCEPLAIDPTLGFNPDCSGQVQTTVACLGYGPPDFSPGGLGGGSSESAKQLNISQETFENHEYAPGVYDAAPMQGFVVWNSHAFNLTSDDTTMNQYFDLWLAAAEHQLYPVQQIFDSSAIFAMNVPPFATQEICKTQTFAPGTRVFELSSHTHRHGVRWRTWAPPNAPCTTGVPGSAPGVCQPGPDDRLIYLSTVYNDPVQLVLDPPVALDSAVAADRTYLYCSLYDNGSTPGGPSVKRQSTSPDPPITIGFLGGPCPDETVACLDGPQKGQLCGTKPDPDGFCGGPGLCDACPVKGGVTTEDEMFILLGNYFVQP